MKIVTLAAILALLSSSAFAQSSSTSSTQSPQASTGSSQTVAAQKIKQDLQNAGFKDVKVVAESFVVQAKSRDGDPVVMTIGPHGMSVFEALNANASNSGTVGSNESATGSSNSSSSNHSLNPNSPTQQK
ncbi:hypothetical protein [Bradyrhizobium sp. STM 3562]|uniref:hypothetical protein n=1 Tax=Bradyrhizobium sp. STM 3562 TaxID=578924 RepID=UPI00388D6113